MILDIRWKAEDLINLLLEKQEKGEVLPADSSRVQSPVLRPKFDGNFVCIKYTSI